MTLVDTSIAAKLISSLYMVVDLRIYDMEICRNGITQRVRKKNLLEV